MTADPRVGPDGDRPVVGVNYHSPRAGLTQWTDWSREELRQDLAAMARAGLQSVRVFLVWRDAQPASDVVDADVLAQVGELVEMAVSEGLTCVVSVFTLWMNGQVLDLGWREGRDLWRDPLCVAAEERLAREVALVVRDRAAHVSLDLGDEIWHADPDRARALRPEEVAAWQTRLADVIRAAAPGVRVMQANDSGAVFGARPYGCDNGSGLDRIAIHAFTPWAPVDLRSELEPRSTLLPAFLVRTCAAFGTPVLDELGAYGVSEDTVAGYLRAASASAVAAGARGVYVWSWRDVTSTAPPYDERPMERATGLVRADGTPKPALEAVTRTATACPRPGRRSATAEVALFLPRRFRGRHGSYLDGAGSAVATFTAFTLLVRNHLTVSVATPERLPDPRDGIRLLVCPSVRHLTMADLTALHTFAERGGTVYLSIGDHIHGCPGPELTGTEVVDTAGIQGFESLTLDGHTLGLDWGAVEARPTIVRTLKAKVLGTYAGGRPAVTRSPLGAGSVIIASAPIEAMIGAPEHPASRAAAGLYATLARLAEVPRRIACSAPEVEVVPDLGAAGDEALLVNHGQEAVRVTVSIDGGTEHHVDLGPKDWAVVSSASRRE